MIFMNSPARDSEISNARLKIDYKLIIFVDSTSNWMKCWKGKKIVSYRKFWVKDYEEREMLEDILKWTELIKLKKTGLWIESLKLRILIEVSSKNKGNIASLACRNGKAYIWRWSKSLVQGKWEEVTIWVYAQPL